MCRRFSSRWKSRRSASQRHSWRSIMSYRRQRISWTSSRRWCRQCSIVLTRWATRNESKHEKPKPGTESSLTQLSFFCFFFLPPEQKKHSTRVFPKHHVVEQDFHFDGKILWFHYRRRMELCCCCLYFFFSFFSFILSLHLSLQTSTEKKNQKTNKKTAQTLLSRRFRKRKPSSSP